jgi:hypothetical protein
MVICAAMVTMSQMCCNIEASRKSLAEDGKVTVQIVSLHLGLCGEVQGIKMVGMLLLKVSECSLMQRGHSRDLVALLK